MKSETGSVVTKGMENLIIDGYMYAGSLDLPTLLGAKDASDDVLESLLNEHPCYLGGVRITLENLMGKFRTALL